MRGNQVEGSLGNARAERSDSGESYLTRALSSIGQEVCQFRVVRALDWRVPLPFVFGAPALSDEALVCWMDSLSR